MEQLSTTDLGNLMMLTGCIKDTILGNKEYLDKICEINSIQKKMEQVFERNGLLIQSALIVS
jgi:hypothetical protein